jgi:hypothetical protein
MKTFSANSIVHTEATKNVPTKRITHEDKSTYSKKGENQSHDRHNTPTTTQVETSKIAKKPRDSNTSLLINANDKKEITKSSIQREKLTVIKKQKQNNDLIGVLSSRVHGLQTHVDVSNMYSMQ